MMRSVHRLLLTLSACVWMTACQSVAAPVTPPTHPPLKMCQAPRPDVCTMQYEPVCGYGSDYRRLGTYGNGCGACGQAEVMGYTEGDCEGKVRPRE